METDSEFFGSTIAQVVDELVERTQVGRHATRADVDKAWHYIGREVCKQFCVGGRGLGGGSKICYVRTILILQRGGSLTWGGSKCDERWDGGDMTSLCECYGYLMM